MIAAAAVLPSVRSRCPECRARRPESREALALGDHDVHTLPVENERAGDQRGHAVVVVRTHGISNDGTVDWTMPPLPLGLGVVTTLTVVTEAGDGSGAAVDSSPHAAAK